MKKTLMALAIAAAIVIIALLLVRAREPLRGVNTRDEFLSRHGTPDYVAKDVLVLSQEPPTDSLLSNCTIVLVDPMEYRDGVDGQMIVSCETELVRHFDAVIDSLEEDGWSTKYPLGRKMLVTYARLDRKGMLIDKGAASCNWIQAVASDSPQHGIDAEWKR